MLVGSSMGGGEVARYFGHYGAERARQAVFVSSVAPFLLETPDNLDGVPQKVLGGMMADVRADRIAFLGGFGKQSVNADASATPDVSDDLLHYAAKTIASFAQPYATQQCITAFGETDFRPDMPKITAPTLFVHGHADQIVPTEASAKQGHEMVKGSRLEVIENGPHGLNFTHTERFNEILLDFLKSLLLSPRPQR